MPASRWHREADRTRLIFSGTCEVHKSAIVAAITTELDNIGVEKEDYIIGGGVYGNRWPVKFIGRGRCSTIEQLALHVKNSYKSNIQGEWRSVKVSYKDKEGIFQFDWDKSARQVRSEQLLAHLARRAATKLEQAGRNDKIEKFKRDGKLVLNGETVCRIEVDYEGKHKVHWRSDRLFDCFPKDAVLADLDGEAKQLEG